MYRLFYTDEKTDNRFFQLMLGRQPSYGWILIEEMDEKTSVFVFLDGRYVEKDFSVPTSEIRQILWGEKEVLLEKIKLDKKIDEFLVGYLADWSEIVLEKQMPYGVVENLQNSEVLWGRNIRFVFDEEHWQDGLRVSKSDDNIVHIQQAIELTDQIWSFICDLAAQGQLIWMTEIALRGKVIDYAMSLWLEDEAFPTIVATWANSAIPHHATWDSVIWAGPLLVDMWFRWQGWCSDFTRVVWITEHEKSSPLAPLDEGGSDSITSNGMEEQGGEKNKFDEVYDIVKQAYDAAVEKIAVWIPFKEIARAARDVIEQAWYGAYFTHSLGHGVGLDIHEAPRVSVKSEDVIQSWMVFTIEPGIYLPGQFGVRLENVVIVNQSGEIEVVSRSRM